MRTRNKRRPQRRAEPQTIEGDAKPIHTAERPSMQQSTMPAKLVAENRNNSHSIVTALVNAIKSLGGSNDNALVQVELMERLSTLQQRMEDRQAEREYGVAKHALAMELPTIPKRHKISFIDKNNQQQEREYADRVDIESVLDPLCRKHGFSKEYSTHTNDKGWSAQVLTVRHASGHKEVYYSPYMPLDTTGAKNNNQGAGSTAEYGKRYAVVGAFNILGVDWDDDGNKGEIPQPAGDKFTEKVQAEAAKPTEAKPDAKAAQSNKTLSLAEAAATLEEKVLAAEPNARGSILMNNIKIIGAMEADAAFAEKAAHLRKLCTPEATNG